MTSGRFAPRHTGAMWKSVGFVALWLVASCAAIAVAWAGVSTVSDEIVAPAPAPTGTTATEPSVEGSATPAAGDAAVAEPPDTTESTDSPTTSAGNVDTADQQAPTTVAGQDPGNGSAPTPVPTTTSPGAPTTTSTTPPPTTAPPTTSSPPTTAPTTTTTLPAGTTETFVLVGGTASVRYESGDVTVLWATPNAGFDVEIEPESPGLKVEFRSDNHRSRVDVWWSNGPKSEIREEPGD